MNDDARGRADPRLRRLVDARARQLDPQVRAWVPDDRLQANLTEELSEQVRWLDDPDFARAFHEACPIEGAQPDDYRNRWLDLAGGTFALVGIRFRGLDLGRPFVELVGNDVDVATRRTADELVRSAAVAYARFRPGYVRVLCPSEGTRPWTDLDGAFVERVWFARPLGELRAEPRPRADPQIALRRPEGRAWTSRVRDAYAALQRAVPQHREYASAPSDEELHGWHAQGLAFEAFVDGEAAGFVAAYRGTALGMRGFGIGEIVLYPARRGTGTGPSLLRALIDVLPGRPDDVVFGQIDGRNLPAVRTARRVGRRPVARYVWVPVPN